MTETRIHVHTRRYTRGWKDGRRMEGSRERALERAHRSHNRSYYLVLRGSMHFINFCHGRMSACPRVAAANLHD